MHGYLPYLIFILYHIECFRVIANEAEYNSAPVKLPEKYLEQRHRLPLFPKTKMKFIITPKPRVTSVYTYSPKEKIMKYIPVIAHTTHKTKSVSLTTPRTSRKPLMKLKTFTIKPLANGRFKNINGNRTTVSNSAIISTRIGVNKTGAPKYAEHDTTDNYFPEESRIFMEKRMLLEKNDEKSINGNKIQNQKVKHPVTMKINAYKFSPEEEQDRNEFIFLETNNVKQTFSDLIDHDGQHFDQGLETTTEFVFAGREFRVKRSKNIIEEENMGSTVSGFKYTGRDTRLNQDLYFKNIHS